MRILMYSYLAYGLNIKSELELPELDSGNGQLPDATIRFGPVEKFEPNVPSRNHWAQPDEIRFSYADVGRFSVRDGREIIIDLDPEAFANLLRVCLLGPVLAALLHQRGLLVLHGSAVSIDGIAIAFLGDKGWGKSTLAACMQASGHGFLADDVLAVRADPMNGIELIPAFPHLKLWPDSAVFLGMNPDNMARLQPELDKRGHRVSNGFSATTLSLNSIYVLDIADSESIRPIEPRDALIELVRHSYLVRYLQPTGRTSLHLEQCAKVVSSVPVYSLQRVRSLSRLPEVVRLLEKSTVTGCLRD